MAASKAPAFWIQTYCATSWRSIGCVIIAGSDAPLEVRGKLIFYRPLNHWNDAYMRRDESVGFSLAVWNHLINNTKVEYVVTYGKDERKMNIAPMSAFTFERNYGQGLQKRADIHSTVNLEDVNSIKFPEAIPHVKVEDEQPRTQTVSYSPPPPQKKGVTQKCGCFFVDGIIERSCGTHQSVWQPVLAARASRSA